MTTSFLRELFVRTTILLACTLSLAFLQQNTSAQSTATAPAQAPSATYLSNVRVVNVFATVRSKDGKIINTLGKDDFTLEEDGHPQTIGYFAHESDLPITLGLLVDTSMSQRRVLEEEKGASGAFLDNMMREKDRAFIIHFDREVELLQDLTSSRHDLETALQLLDTPHLEQNGQDSDDRRGGRMRGNFGTQLYDAIFLAANEVLKKQEGRKAIVVLTDGVDTSSKVTLERAIEAAQHSDVLVYTIYFKDDQGYGGFERGGGMGGGGRGGRGGMGSGRYPGGGRGGPGGGRPAEEKRPDGKKILERISRETGARMFEITKKQSVEQIYTQIAEELRSQYSLGYTPDATTHTAGYHTIHLAAKPKGMTVQSREAYYSAW